MPSCDLTIAVDRSTVTSTTTNSGTIREIEGMRAVGLDLLEYVF